MLFTPQIQTTVILCNKTRALKSDSSKPPQTMRHELLTILLIPDEVRDAEGCSQLQFHIGVTLNHREEKQNNDLAGEKDSDKGEANNRSRRLRQAIRKIKMLQRTDKLV